MELVNANAIDTEDIAAVLFQQDVNTKFGQDQIKDVYFKDTAGLREL